MVLGNVQGEKVDDSAYCTSRSFLGVVSGFSREPLWGAPQMFVVINARASGSAYQLAFGFNDMLLKSRKYENGVWSGWRDS